MKRDTAVRSACGLAVALICLRAQFGMAAEDPSLNASREAASQLRAACGPGAKVGYAPRSGRVSFIACARGAGIPVQETAQDPGQRALSFIAARGAAFGIADESQVRVVRAAKDPLGVDHVRLQQVYQDVPVTGGELMVHLKGAQVVVVNGRTLPNITLDTTPTVSAAQALEAVQDLVRRELNAPDAELSEPALQILDRGLFGGAPAPTLLTWFVEARGESLREYVWVDARRGGVLLHFSQRPDARTRRVYDAGNSSTLPGTLRRNEGDPDTSDLDVDSAYRYAGDTYDYYWNEHGRDSYDNAGAPIISSVHVCSGACPWANAAWTGTQMVYGEGFASADDVVGHELTHAVTEHSAGLYYYMQSGALNESFSDIFGETIDLTNGSGTDTPEVRWLLGEDVPGSGAIRNMMNPPAFGDPGKMSDAAHFYCGGSNGTGDNGGVHHDSGVPNHAYALMADGGTYNGYAIAGIGLTKAGKIEYRALTTYLLSASDFLDDYNALQQSCSDLIGTAGITAADCVEVAKALDAVEMSQPWPCSPVQPTAPALCPAGETALDVWLDDFENITSGRWDAATLSGINHWDGGAGDAGLYWDVFATSGTHHLWGFDYSTVGDSAAQMTSGVTLPAGARMQFNHSFGFYNNGASVFDGGVVEYCAGACSNWSDAGPLISAGAGYNGAVLNGYGNPLAGRNAFTRESWGYTASQLDLGALAGQNVRFRFRVGTGGRGSDDGWFVDDVRIYQCVGGECAYAIDPTLANVGMSGGAGSVTVTAAGGCPWTATSNAPWITITSGSTGSGTGSVAYSVTANNGSARTGTITIGDRTSAVLQASGLGTIAGTVTAEGTGVPLANVEVDIYAASGGYSTYGFTDALGAYTVGPVLAPGTYFARTSNSQGYVEKLYDNLTCPGGACGVITGTPITVTAGATTTGINFALAPGGRISGTVTSAATSLPLANVEVVLYSLTRGNVYHGYTNSSGVYTVESALEPGTYAAVTRNSLGYIDQLYGGIQCPESCTLNDGTPVVVTAGTTTTGIDFALAPGGRISGRVTDVQTGAPISNIRVDIFDASGRNSGGGYTDRSGIYASAGGLPVGSYYAKTSNSQGYIDGLFGGLLCPGVFCSSTIGTPISVSAGATVSGIDFALTRGGRISGTVTEASTGAPIWGVPIEVYDTGGVFLTSGGTDSSGVYTTAAGLPSGTYYLRTANTRGYVDELYNDVPCAGDTCSVTTGAPVTVIAGVTTAGVDFALVAAGGISGTVTGAPSGTPLNGVTVFVYNTAGSRVAVATTDSAGAYRTTGVLPTGNYYARTSNSFGYIEKLYGGISCPFGSCLVTSGNPIGVVAGLTTAGIDFALAPGGRISGTVTDAATGLPLAAVTVEIYSSVGTRLSYGRTDSAGTYTSDTGLSTGTYYARTSNWQGYLDKLYSNLVCPAGSCVATSGTPITVTEGATASGKDFALSAGGRISGVVTASDDVPLGNVSVKLYDSTGTLFTAAVTRASGVYTTGPGLPAATYYARTENSYGYLDELYNDIPCGSGSCTATIGTPIVVATGATTSADFVLSRGGRITGTVTDAATGLPLSNVSVRLYSSAGASLTAASTNASGVYAAMGLAAGTYYVTTANSLKYIDGLYDAAPCPGGYCTVTAGTPIVVPAGATTGGIDFRLTKGGQITGAVTNAATGAPLSGIWVWVYNSSGQFLATQSTDGSGVYRTPGLPPGSYFARTWNDLNYVDKLYNSVSCPLGVCAVTSGTPITVAGVGVTTANFTLVTGGRITGTVLDAATGLPLPNVSVRLYTSAGASLTAFSTNASGVYTAAGLPAGTYYATTWNSLGYIDGLYSAASCPGGYCTVTTGTPIVVAAGVGRNGIDFQLTKGGVITGVVTDAATGAPLSGTWVWVYSSSGHFLATQSTNSSGVYRTPGLPSGSYFARTWNDLNYVDKLFNNISCPLGVCTVQTGTPITIAGTGEATADFALTTGGRVVGSVTDVATGVALAGVSVRIYGSSGAYLTSFPTDNSGAYTAPGLPAGTYFARTSNSIGYVDKLYNGIACPGGACLITSGTPISVAAGATTSGIDFALTTSGGRISGTVTDTGTGLPLANVPVYFYSAAGYATYAITNSSGAYTSRAGLASRTYYAVTSAGLGYVDELYNNIPCPGGACTPTSGTPIAVTVGNTTAGIDFGLLRDVIFKSGFE